MLQFFPVELAMREIHSRYWSLTPVHYADYTFANLWGWAIEYGLEWTEAHGLFWVRRTRRGDMPTERFWAPIGDWSSADWDSIASDMPSGTVWERVPESLCSQLKTLMPERICIEETRGQWEYLYSQKALATLSGNKLHKKKNHYNTYIKSYGEDYRTLGEDDIEHILQFECEWCRCHECDKSPSLQAENNAVLRVLTRWESLGTLIGAGLFVGDKMSAFTVGEALDDKTMVIHFEKARLEYKGAYQAINACFARYAGASFELINREQDADEEGLRQAKEGYYPLGFIVKNRIIFK